MWAVLIFESTANFPTITSLHLLRGITRFIKMVSVDVYKY